MAMAAGMAALLVQLVCSLAPVGAGESTCLAALRAECAGARAASAGCDACRVGAGLAAGCSQDEVRQYCSSLLPPSAPPAAGKPNIIMVLGDDIGFANVGWNREAPTREVSTPNLDALVAEGVQLLDFYAFKYCSPSRW
jgi:hypothetical protein